MESVNSTLESFNAFLGEKLSTAAHEIFRFVERTVTEYHLEVERTKQENQRLQRLVDLIYKPDIRLRRSDSGHICLPTSTLEKLIQTERIVKEEPDDPDPPAEEVTVMAEEDQVIEVEEVVKTPIGKRSQTFLENNHHKSLPSGKEREIRGKQFTQRTCGKTSKRNMKVHKKRRTEQSSYECYICKKCFLQSNRLKKHMARAHKGADPFSCLQCKELFTTYIQFKRHMRKIHNVACSGGQILPTYNT